MEVLNSHSTERIEPMQFRKTTIIIISLSIVLAAYMIFANSSSQDQYIYHTLRRGESISFICIKYYGHYSEKMGTSIKKWNPRIKNLNRVSQGTKLKLLDPNPPKKSITKKTPKKSSPLFTKKIDVTQGVITYVRGDVYLKRKNSSSQRRLAVNTLVYPGDEIMTKANGYAEIIVNRESVSRLRGNTKLVLQKYRNAQQKKGKTTFKVIYGTIWSKIKKYKDKVSRFELSLPTAIAGVHGTVYQTEVHNDSTSDVKVYRGEVAVKNQENSQKSQNSSGGLDEVNGPSEVKGPHEVSMEEWTRIVRSMQKISIGKEGKPSDVVPFKKDQSNEWEVWNEKRDNILDEFFLEL